MRKNTPLLTRLQPVALETQATGEGVIKGLASTFGGEPDSYGPVILKGAFTKSLAQAKAYGETPAMLWAHAQERPVGKWLAITEDEGGLWVRGQLNLNTTEGQQAYAHVKADDTTGLSFGCTMADDAITYKGGGVYEVGEIDLMEVSIVAIPANRNARITAAKSFGSKAEIADALREIGVAKKAAAVIAAGGWQALNGEPDNSTQIAALTAEIDRATALINGVFQNGYGYPNWL